MSCGVGLSWQRAEEALAGLGAGNLETGVREPLPALPLITRTRSNNQQVDNKYDRQVGSS